MILLLLFVAVCYSLDHVKLLYPSSIDFTTDARVSDISKLLKCDGISEMLPPCIIRFEDVFDTEENDVRQFRLNLDSNIDMNPATDHSPEFAFFYDLGGIDDKQARNLQAGKQLSDTGVGVNWYSPEGHLDAFYPTVDNVVDQFSSSTASRIAVDCFSVSTRQNELPQGKFATSTALSTFIRDPTRWSYFMNDNEDELSDPLWRTTNLWSNMQAPPFHSGVKSSQVPIMHIKRTLVVPSLCARVKLEVVGAGNIRLYWNGDLIFCSTRVRGCDELLKKDSANNAFFRTTLTIQPSQLRTTSRTQHIAVALRIPTDHVPFELRVISMVNDTECVSRQQQHITSHLSETAQWIFASEPVSTSFSSIANPAAWPTSENFHLPEWSKIAGWKALGTIARDPLMAFTHLKSLRLPDCSQFQIHWHANGPFALFIDKRTLYCGPPASVICSSMGFPTGIQSPERLRTDGSIVVQTSVLNTKIPPVLGVFAMGAETIAGIQLFVNTNSSQQTLECSGTCNDGMLNGLETGVDCGGHCETCRVPTEPMATTTEKATTTGRQPTTTKVEFSTVSKQAKTVATKETVSTANPSNTLATAAPRSTNAGITQTTTDGTSAETTEFAGSLSHSPVSSVSSSPAVSATDINAMSSTSAASAFPVALVAGLAGGVCLLLLVVAVSIGFLLRRRANNDNNNTSGQSMSHTETTSSATVSTELETMSARNNIYGAAPSLDDHGANYDVVPQEPSFSTYDAPCSPLQ